MLLSRRRIDRASSRPAGEVPFRTPRSTDFDAESQPVMRFHAVSGLLVCPCRTSCFVVGGLLAKLADVGGGNKDRKTRSHRLAESAGTDAIIIAEHHMPFIEYCHDIVEVVPLLSYRSDKA